MSATGDGSPDFGAHRSVLTVTLADGTVLSPEESADLVRSRRRPAPRQTDTVALEFPADRIVGVVDWDGAWDLDTGPVLATGTVHVPTDREVALRAGAIAAARRHGDSWELVPDARALDLGFLRALPPDAIDALDVSRVDPASFAAVRHLAPGLRRLCLAWSELGDTALPDVAALSGLTYLQTFGNAFTDAGVQQLAALTELRELYLEEATLSAAAFAFADRLPHLTRLGLQDVPLTADDVATLRARLPGVAVGEP